MRIHCVHVKQIKKGQYMFLADGIVEVHGYYYPIVSGAVVFPDEKAIIITDKTGKQYKWKYISHHSEWLLNNGHENVIIRRFNGVNADIMTIYNENNRMHKTRMIVGYRNLLYDLPQHMIRLNLIS